MDASGGLLADPGHPDRPGGPVDRGGTVTQTRSPISKRLPGSSLTDSVHISQVKLPDGVTPANTDEDFTVATIVAPSAMKAEEEVTAPEGAVPTVEEGEAEAEAEGQSEE